jgi:hypothetical protein
MIFLDLAGDPKTVLRLKAFDEENGRISTLLDDGQALQTTDLEMLLAINHELRRLFDMIGEMGLSARLQFAGSGKVWIFDEQFRPILGSDKM